MVDWRDDKTILNSYTQSGGIRVQTPVMTSDLTISAFLPVELGLMGHRVKSLTMNIKLLNIKIYYT